MTARHRDVADVELERFETAERAARESGDDVEPIPFAHDLGDVCATECDPVEDVQTATQRQLAMAAGRGSYPRDGQPEHRDQRIGVAGPTWSEPRQLPVEGVVDIDGGERQVDGY